MKLLEQNKFEMLLLRNYQTCSYDGLEMKNDGSYPNFWCPNLYLFIRVFPYTWAGMSTRKTKPIFIENYFLLLHWNMNILTPALYTSWSLIITF